MLSKGSLNNGLRPNTNSMVTTLRRSSEVVYCELCGQPIHGERFYIELEGTELVVCSRCYRRHVERSHTLMESARLRGLSIKPGAGTINSTVSRPTSPSPGASRRATQYKRRTEHHPRVTPTRTKRATPRLDIIEKYEVVPNYAEIIRRARERLGWTQRILAEKVKESERVIRRIEAGELVPTIDLARRLERILGVKLLEPVIEVEEEDTQKHRGFHLTLGDVAEIRED